MTDSMIVRQPIPDGVLLIVRPFSEPNKNAACEIVAKVTSSRGTRRDARISVQKLKKPMTLSDTAILMTAVRVLTTEAEQQMGQVQEQARKTIQAAKARKKKKK